MKLFRLAVAVWIVAASAAWAGSPTDSAGDSVADEAKWAERGAEALRPFKQNLMKALMAGLENGPEEAVSVCRTEAPRIAAEQGSAEIRMGRTSHKLRNPDNAPAAWMEPLLVEYEAAGPGAAPRVVPAGDNLVGYVEPIHVTSRCLGCHGETISAPLASRIDELYPDDKAKGFADGDFRGLFWVELTRAGVP